MREQAYPNRPPQDSCGRRANRFRLDPAPKDLEALHDNGHEERQLQCASLNSFDYVLTGDVYIVWIIVKDVAGGGSPVGCVGRAAQPPITNVRYRGVNQPGAVPSR